MLKLGIYILIGLSLVIKGRDINIEFVHSYISEKISGNIKYGNTSVGRQECYLQYFTDHHNFSPRENEKPFCTLWKGNSSNLYQMAMDSLSIDADVLIYEGGVPDPKEILLLKKNQVDILVIVLNQSLSALLEEKSITTSSQLLMHLNVLPDPTEDDPSVFERLKKDVVHYEAWYIPGDPEMLAIFKELAEMHKMLGSNVTFTPHLKVWPSKYHNSIRCSNCLCFKKTRYCTLPKPSMGDLRGEDLLLLGIAELCLYDHLTDPTIWYQYQAKVRRCSFESLTKGCAHNALLEAGMNETQLALCEGNIEARLATEARKSAKYGIYPSGSLNPPNFLLINGKNIKGELNATYTLNTICSNYRTLPNYCQGILDMSTIADSCRVPWILVVILMISLVLITLFLLYRHYQKHSRNSTQEGSIPLQQAT